MKKDYELFLVRIDHGVEQVFISDKVKRNKLRKRLPELKCDINSAIQLNKNEFKVLCSCEQCSITIYKGKTRVKKCIKGDYNIQIHHDSLTLIKL